MTHNSKQLQISWHSTPHDNVIEWSICNYLDAQTVLEHFCPVKSIQIQYR